MHTNLWMQPGSYYLQTGCRCLCLSRVSGFSHRAARVSLAILYHPTRTHKHSLTILKEKKT